MKRAYNYFFSVVFSAVIVLVFNNCVLCSEQLSNFSSNEKTIVYGEVFAPVYSRPDENKEIFILCPSKYDSSLTEKDLSQENKCKRTRPQATEL